MSVINIRRFLSGGETRNLLKSGPTFVSAFPNLFGSMWTYSVLEIILAAWDKIFWTFFLSTGTGFVKINRPESNMMVCFSLDLYPPRNLRSLNSNESVSIGTLTTRIYKNTLTHLHLDQHFCVLPAVW